MFAARLLSCLALVLVGLGVSVKAQAADEAAIRAFLRKEGLGGLRLDQPAKEVIQLLGKPEKQGKLALQEADGNYVQTWSYPAKGLQLVMSAGGKKDGAKTLAMITARAPCDLATQRGIKIGSPASAPRKAYAAFADPDSPPTPDAFVVVSVYGGIIFNFEHGKVSRIFFGAAAE
ncbi:MAG: hypothetical protein ABJF10_28205 [Chthoniobacter sp.]|uniref:hypothetical protein n=1 Tax=Chthoniobacter sp. TaxID=2510640 RepID=UPI0032A6D3EF